MADALNARHIATLKPREIQYDVFDGDTPGLALRVGKKRKTWMLFYRLHGKLRRLALGHFPKVKLEAARKLATDSRAQVFHLEDPGAAKSQAKLDAISTVTKLVELYAADPVNTAKASWTEEQRVLDKDVLPTWGDRALVSLTRADVRELVNAKAATGKAVMSNRLLAHVSHLLNYALDLDLIDANPAARLKKRPVASRERVLTRDEVRDLWRYVTEGTAPEDAKVPEWSTTTRDLFAVLLATGQRLGEVARMMWADVDLDTTWWTLPATATKNKHTHRVPLSTPVVAILRRRRPATAEGVERQVYVFSTIDGSNVYDRTKKAMAQLCRAFTPKDAAPGGAWTNARAHDLRRTMATGLGELGIAPHVISAVLNHTDGSITAVYNRFKYDVEKRAALDKWAKRLDATAQATTADVVSMQGRS